jgi:hypothetical protein
MSFLVRNSLSDLEKRFTTNYDRKLERNVFVSVDRSGEW